MLRVLLFARNLQGLENSSNGIWIIVGYTFIEIDSGQIKNIHYHFHIPREENNICSFLFDLVFCSCFFFLFFFLGGFNHLRQIMIQTNNKRRFLSGLDYIDLNNLVIFINKDG